MVVEDNPADVLLVKETLHQKGVDCVLQKYTNGEDAAKEIEAMTEPPDLIILDINVSRIDGLELLRLIRSRGLIAKATVAILTSSQAPSDQTRAEQLGANMYIVKPPGYHEFLHTVG